MKPVRLAIIGARGHYRTVLSELKDLPGVQLSAVSDGGDTVEPVLQWCRENGHPPPERFQTHAEMLERAAPQAVVVCGPFELHASMSIDAIERGVHVLTEKPAALNFQDLARLRD